MKVKLDATWFAPNGFRYKKGEQDIPDELVSMLPKRYHQRMAAQAAMVNTVEVSEVDRAVVDDERAASDALTALHDKAEKNYQHMMNARKRKGA